MEFTDLERLDAPALPVLELPWESIAGRLEQLTIAILRFDARLEASGLAAGWQSRCDMTEAVRALLLDGHLVDVGDLVLHDAGMDVRHPTHELTRAAAALRARRTATARKAPWPVSIDGLAALRGLGGVAEDTSVRSKVRKPNPDDEEAYLLYANDADLWKAHFAEIDALLDRTNQVLAGETPLRTAARIWSMTRIRMKPRPRTCGLTWSSAPARGQPSPQPRWRGTRGSISTSTPACRGSG
ncbi:hypothetical protein [Microvirga lotononidis]|uniref:DUF222 domain-containing protein n=1 Tax=Microvirga lotononidis TaxID=864069 RepID=I4Z4V1_9HYPH|nr:hypothetical protein [Microvirga lotononidis]EIM31243.1 hypothetical protein MicloDRAFT_00002330 [Microvirga lotononidis]WQO29977.1 hypothetical protein U0023_26520 [Microvirga lotononidis]WQO30600.1 hypothetical protein U0023_24480 [Microvirga lotononidis]